MCPFPEALSREDRRSLLLLAHRCIHSAVVLDEYPLCSPPPGPLSRPAGAFVTLHHHGRLRGCIGRIEAREALATVVASCAVSAALHDGRFRPVTPEELPGLEIEISVLSDVSPLAAEAIVPGRHGLVVTGGGRRGLLLPQVAAEHHWDGKRFLEETCVKAGLPRDGWSSPGTRIEGFTAEIFSDADFLPPLPAPAL